MKNIYLILSLLPSLSFAQQEFPELKVKAYSPRIYLQRDTNIGGFIQGIQTQLQNGTENWFFGSLGTQNWIVSKGDYTGVKFSINENGNVGIGTHNPREKLDVEGNAKIKSYSPRIYLQRNTDQGGFIQGIQTQLLDGKDNWFFGNLHHNQWIVSKGDYTGVKFSINENGNIGIGTQNPREKLDVEGNAKIKSYSPRIYLQRDTDQGGFIQGIQTQLQNGKDNWFFGNLHHNQWIVSKGDYTDVKFSINENGNAALQGKLEAKEIKVTESPTADFVFEEDYKLPTLQEVEKHIKEKKHLPEIASAKQMEKEGVNVGEFQIQLLQKIEELTLYIIELNKEIQELKNK